MVTKPRRRRGQGDAGFESCVVLDGDKTFRILSSVCTQFESCVVLDGDKTAITKPLLTDMFESCVVLDGD